MDQAEENKSHANEIMQITQRGHTHWAENQRHMQAEHGLTGSIGYGKQSTAAGQKTDGTVEQGMHETHGMHLMEILPNWSGGTKGTENRQADKIEKKQQLAGNHMTFDQNCPQRVNPGKPGCHCNRDKTDQHQRHDGPVDQDRKRMIGTFC